MKHVCVCGYTLWIYWLSTLKNTDENRIFFVRFATPPVFLAKLSTSCFEYSGEVSCSLLVNPRHTDKSWERQNTCLWIYALNLFIEHTLLHWRQKNMFCLLTTPQSFWKSSAPGALSTLVTSAVLYSLIWATLMSPGKDETRICGYTLWTYSLSTLENTDENWIFFVRSPHHKHFGKA